MTRKKVLLGGAILVAFLAIIICVVSIFGKRHVTTFDPAFKKYIAGYSARAISRESSFKIKLMSDIVQKIDTKKPLPEDVIEIHPKVKGTAFWNNDGTLEFKPEKSLDPNTEYTVEFNLGKLVDVPSRLKTFAFATKTYKQNFEVYVNEIITTDRKEFKFEKIIGTVKIADVEEEEKISKLLKITLDGKEYKAKWSSSNQKEYKFSIDSVQRTSKNQEMEIAWDGDCIEVDKRGSTKVEIPALNTFKILFTNIVQEQDQYLKIQFSDPINDAQDIEGLITIQNISGLRYLVEDNVIKVFPPNRLDGNYQVTIDEGIQNAAGKKLGKTESLSILFEAVKPAVRFVGKGVILPTSEHGLVLPFEAVNLRAVDVRVIKIYENSVTQFLQVNDLDGENEMVRVGVPVLKKTIRLDQTNVVDFGKWNRYSLDLNELIQKEPGAIYRIVLSFNLRYSTFPCGEVSDSIANASELNNTADNWEPNEINQSSYWDNYENYYSGGYDYDSYWENRDNPCKDAYYNGKQVATNIIASNLGLITKRGSDASMQVFVTDLRTTKPLSDVNVEVVTYQNQIIKSGKTGTDGKVEFKEVKNPYFIIARYEKQRGYLKVTEGNSLQLSKFSVEGGTVAKGLKGFIYGERGVWRPGDSVFVTFILQEQAEPLPKGHPVIFEVKNTRDQLVTRQIQEKNETGFYTYKFTTSPEAITGNYVATVQVGGVTFTKILKIETVKPNRMKINLDFGRKQIIATDKLTANMNVKWLHGAPAVDLKTKIELIMAKSETKFARFKEYEFNDPTISYYSESTTVFEGSTGENGNVTVEPEIKVGEDVPGVLNATFFTRVFEKGGDFSVDQVTLPFYPYKSYVGLKLPKGDKARGMLLTDNDHSVDIVLVDANGNQIKNPHNLEVSFYKVNWKWWWDKSDDDLTSYNSKSYIQPIKKETITAVGGKASWKIRVNYPDWGRYLVKVKDLNDGHSCSKAVYIDWPGWAGRGQKDGGEGATMLMFNADKEKYSVNDKVKLTIPTAKNGRALISIENGTKVLQTEWIETTENQTIYTFTATADMTPNVYVNITLLQPHAQTANDLPIRMYGVIPIYVENPKTHLEPVINMPNELQAETKANITVSEKNGREMTYTLAIVDEGLLDLTRYQTPNPWNEFYAKEALGVKTWDIYDWVIGAFGGELERLLAIGGDAMLGGKDKAKANRFPPMVKFLGPFHLKGGSKTHTIQLPQYIGSVRTMVIAGDKGSYGCAEKSTPVKKPLMLLASLPRVLGTGETLKLPVDVFVMENNLKNVTVRIENNNLVKVKGNKSVNLTFNKTGEQLAEFELEVAEATGIAKIDVIATSGSQTIKTSMEVDVRNPNPRVSSVIPKILEAGESWSSAIQPIGIKGTNKITLEVSSIPPLNLDKRLRYLITYPYGCIEQTTSGAFPQLYLSNFIDISAKNKEEIAQNIKAAIARIASMQISSGGLSYWPGSSEGDEWGTCYGGHFMLEAEKAGYSLPSGFIAKWTKYQKRKAENWIDDGNSSQLIQAYRLYTLALAGQADKGSMNRMRERSKLSVSAKWRLAAAYLLAGKTDVASQLVANIPYTVPVYNEMSFTYGSETRDKAMILETLLLLGKKKESFTLVKEISEELSSEKWLSTQTTAYSLMALSKYVSKNVTSSNTKFSYKFGNNVQQTINAIKPMVQCDLLPNDNAGTLNLSNNSSGVLFVRVILEGVPPLGEETDEENGLRLTVSYLDMDNNSLDVDELQQGTDFVAEVSIVNTGTQGMYSQMALTQIFPSGWEILNTRLLNLDESMPISIPTYQDFRDDRVNTFFNIEQNNTKIFRVKLTASYLGHYYLPAVTTEAMYDHSIYARKKGKWVNVVR